MYLSLGNYAGDQIVDLEDGPDIVPFTTGIDSIFFFSYSSSDEDSDVARFVCNMYLCIVVMLCIYRSLMVSYTFVANKVKCSLYVSNFQF